MNSERQSNFELLRIVCMILIVMHHFAVHGIGEVNNVILETNYDFIKNINYFFYRFAYSYGKLGVDVFILISAYFLIDSNFKIKKILFILFQVFTYSTLIYIIFITINPSIFSVSSLISSFFPILTREYWFATGYVILYLLSPILNKIIKNINQYTHLIVIFISMVILYFFKNETVFFFVLYFIASYIKIYDIKTLNKQWFAITLFATSFVLMPLLKILLDINLYFVESPLLVICAVSMFYMFKNIKNIGKNKFINILSSTTFGIYLIHDNPYVRKWLWTSLINTKALYNSNYFILLMILTVVLVFLSCCIIDYLKKQSIDKVVTKLIKKICQHNCR